jgi:hypothetical protein
MQISRRKKAIIYGIIAEWKAAGWWFLKQNGTNPGWVEAPQTEVKVVYQKLFRRKKS